MHLQLRADASVLKCKMLKWYNKQKTVHRLCGNGGNRVKIATWNIERLAHKKQLEAMLSACNKVNADILVLTESDTRLTPEYPYCFHTPNPPPSKMAGYDTPVMYAPTECRVSIYTRYPCIRGHITFDQHTAVCLELETELGPLLVYGTIIGIHGNREESFKTDLEKQLKDFCNLSSCGKNLCIIGDYNCSFADNYYFTNQARDSLRQCFADNNIRLLTGSQPQCVDHIAISERFYSGSNIQVDEWNLDKKLSDHKGILVTLD